MGRVLRINAVKESFNDSRITDNDCNKVTRQKQPCCVFGSWEGRKTRGEVTLQPLTGWILSVIQERSMFRCCSLLRAVLGPSHVVVQPLQETPITHARVPSYVYDQIEGYLLKNEITPGETRQYTG